MRSGARLDRWGLRTVPSLRYLGERPHFARHVYVELGGEREDVGPAGGFMLDGRVGELSQQALAPMLDPAEMANDSLEDLATRLRQLPYREDFRQVFGDAHDQRELTDEAAAALAAFENEDPSFHPYSSRFDRYLRGEAKLSSAELEGLRLFDDPSKGNCAACHTLASGARGRPPQFTDYSYHALGVPRNPAVPANQDARFFDLGICGPVRTDLRQETAYCGYFKTPTLRNVARRHFFFHNGRFTSLEEVMQFYVKRDLAPERFYSQGRQAARKFDDLPPRYRANVDTSDAPLNRDFGSPPALNEQEITAVIAFLKTLDDAQ